MRFNFVYNQLYTFKIEREELFFPPHLSRAFKSKLIGYKILRGITGKLARL